MTGALLNHLWESTLFSVAIAALTLLFRHHRAAIRHGLWLAASVKFLIPFSLFVALGNQVELRRVPPATAAVVFITDQVLQPFTSTLAAPVVESVNRWPVVLLTIWAAGFAIIAAVWIRRWLALRAAIRDATPLPLDLPIPVRSSASRLEPGVFGIFRPVLLLPAGIANRLTPAQFTAILAHELAHVRRRDNLAAAIHMLVEALFWFHPLVWWIEQRMVEERERACDEEVLRATADSEAYAAGILEVCKLYLESPLTCVAGVTGSDLKKRITAIMTNPLSRQLSLSRKILLSAAALAAVTAPIGIGMLRAQSPAQQSLTFDVATIKISRDKRVPPSLRTHLNGVDITSFSVRNLIVEAYGVSRAAISTADARLTDVLDQPYDISARSDREPSKAQLMQMLQSLLAERFKLTLHRESKEEKIYKLVVASGGPKLQPASKDSAPACALGAEGGAVCRNMSMPAFSAYLSERMGRTVADGTALAGSFDFVLKLEGTPGYNAIKNALSEGSDPGEAKRTLAAASRDWTSSSIFTDLPKQLGLRLDNDKGPVEHLVVDRLEKPSAN